MSVSYAIARLQSGTREMSEIDRVIAEQGVDDSDSFDMVVSRITVGLGGSKSFQTQTGDALPAPLRGYIIEAVKMRSYYPLRDMNSDYKLPFCASVGGKFGVVAEPVPPEYWAAVSTAQRPHQALIDFDNNGQVAPKYDCDLCPMSQFGSAHQGGMSRAQACKVKVRMVFLPDGWQFPALLTIPSMSIKGWNQFVSALKLQSGRPYFAHRVELGIEKRESSGKQPYGEVTFKSLGPIEDVEQIKAILSIQQAMGRYVRERRAEEEAHEEAVPA